MLFRTLLITLSILPFLFAEEHEKTPEYSEEKKKPKKMTFPDTLEGVKERLAEIKKELLTVKREKKVKQKIEKSEADSIFEQNVKKSSEGVKIFNEMKMPEHRIIYIETPEFKKLKKETTILKKILKKFKDEEVFQKRELIKQSNEDEEELNKALLNENYIEPEIINPASLAAAEADIYWKKNQNHEHEKSFQANHLIIKKFYLGMKAKEFLATIRNGPFKENNFVMINGKPNPYSLTEIKYYDQKDFGSISYKLDSENRITSLEFVNKARDTLFGISGWTQERFLKAFKKKYSVMSFEKDSNYINDEFVIKYTCVDERRQCKIEILPTGFKISALK